MARRISLLIAAAVLGGALMAVSVGPAGAANAAPATTSAGAQLGPVPLFPPPPPPPPPFWGPPPPPPPPFWGPPPPRFWAPPPPPPFWGPPRRW
ncbi:hypothetical protein JNN96_18965 [Mycobacterium sp. DSM 3803]|nr:hypothetical protein [Mycobacterium sp. DSM 3803]